MQSVDNIFVPFVDLNLQYKSIKEEIDSAVQNVVNDAAFINGKYVKEFEDAFRGLHGVKHCIGVGNGTDSLFIIMKMLGIGNGDEVIVPANSWISSSETISLTGARPVFVDVDKYYLMDLSRIEEKVTENTKAIMPVHLYGQMVEMDQLMKLAEKHNLFVIEDCAQSHFSKQNGRLAGTFGIASSFSFYPSKNLGAYGDAGCILTNDDVLANKCRMYANHGSLKKHHHQMEGINSRMDGIQAAILKVKLHYIEEWNKKRNEVASYYNERLKVIPQITTPEVLDNNYHTYHLYVIKALHRNELKEFLTSEGIGCDVHYPLPLPLLDVYNYLQTKSSEYNTVRSNCSQILSLPMYAELSKDQIDFIVGKIEEFYSYSDN